MVSCCSESDLKEEKEYEVLLLRFIYWFESQAREGVKGQIEMFYQLVYLQMIALAGLGPVQSQYNKTL